MGVACLEFRGENFCGWLKNCKIRERFLPRKFPAIRYPIPLVQSLTFPVYRVYANRTQAKKIINFSAIF